MAADIERRHSPEAIDQEIRLFEQKVTELRRGEITEGQFRPFRLKHGIYGQRQPGYQMVRVKVPSGILKAEQLRVLADIADRFSTGRAHVTTRQNCQFHFVGLENVPTIMRLLAAVGLTTREACGNTVRNVTCCPLAGICTQEHFDVTPYALATTRLFLRHPEFNDLPRKFKIAFSGCNDDANCTAAAINDVAVIASLRHSNGTVQRGFKVMVGGGLGSLPTEAQTLSDFLAEAELLPTIEAVLRVFNKTGNRRNKLKARLKFVLREKGIEELRHLVELELAGQTQSEGHPSVPAPPSPLLATPVTPRAEGQMPADGYERWAEHNLTKQRQTGYGAAWIKLPAGNIFSDQFRGLADLLERHGLEGARIAISQDLIVPWLPLASARAFYEGLHTLRLDLSGAHTVSDVTACPGATTCNLGITRSLTLAEVLSEELSAETDSDVLKIRIKISGCPNSCGQHHIADMGLYGNARKIGQQLAPYYMLMVGGQVSSDGVQFARQLFPIPARRVPQALRLLIEAYKAGRADGESFHSWTGRTPDESIRAHLRGLVDFGEADNELFVDWGDRETYSLKLGRGECAA